MVSRLVESDREGKEKYETFEDARKTLVNRRRLEVERYKQLYKVDIDDKSNYDFVIDSSHRLPEELAEEVWQEYQKFLKSLK